ncbi:MAG: NadS family protein [Metallibacterium sp.]
MTTFFDDLMASVQQMDEIVRGERAPGREFHVAGTDVRRIRAKTGLSQAKFAKLIHVETGTLRNWEQGRREPTGPAQVLLTVVDKNPKAVLEALS